MCEAVEKLIQKGKAEGIAEGISVGENKIIHKMRISEMTEEQINAILRVNPQNA